jgi:hypothetical protein
MFFLPIATYYWVLATIFQGKADVGMYFIVRRDELQCLTTSELTHHIFSTLQ